jgi:serine/threonine-protein kinase
MELFIPKEIPLSSFDPKLYLGKDIGNITIMSVLGRGAMGAVFIGFQKSLKRKVAVKIYPKSSPESSKMRLRFRDEAETVAVLNHPNIVPVFDMGETDELLYIIMQLIDGEDLRAFLHRQMLHPVVSKRTIPLQTCLQIMTHIIDALSYAHDENVIHRDIKPANILLDSRSRRPYLADFGIARSALSETGPSNIIMGTPLYISPEQVWGHNVDNRSDIYSTGIVLYELIVGKLPVKKMSVDIMLAIKMNEPERMFQCSPSEASPVIDSDLEDIILTAIKPEIDERYQSCKELYNDLVTYYNKHFADRL